MDNQPGAGGINAANQMRSARPDGYTLALLSNGAAISVGLFKRLPYDPVKDFAPISSMGYFDFLFCGRGLAMINKGGQKPGPREEIAGAFPMSRAS